jgi:hypothetical protein
MTMSRRNFCKALTATSLLTTAGCASKFGSKSSYITQIIEPRNHNTVFHWIDIIMQQTRDQRVPPPRAAYNFAMPMTAGFLAANGIIQKYHQHLGLPDASAGMNPEVAYGVAFATAAAEVFQTPFLMELNKFLAKFPDNDGKGRAIEYGRKIGRQIVLMRSDDGSEASEVNYYLDRYKRRKDSLKWSPTLPAFGASPSPAFGSYARGLFPGHGKITPWTMSSSSQFRVGQFYDPRSPEFAAEFDHVRHMGAADSRMRTKDQSEISLFWEDGPWGITPPGHFIYIGMQILQHDNMSFIDMARAFCLMGMTQCDASINAWDSKYHYDIIRPETAIRNRSYKFKNPDSRVKVQSNWRSFIPTPEFPSYTSGHSTFGAAGTKMIELFHGQDSIRMTGKSPDLVLWPQLRDVQRHWTSLSQIAEENGLSRIYGGVHWEIDHTEAMRAGKSIAEQAFHSVFPPRYN